MADGDFVDAWIKVVGGARGRADLKYVATQKGRAYVAASCSESVNKKWQPPIDMRLDASMDRIDIAPPPPQDGSPLPDNLKNVGVYHVSMNIWKNKHNGTLQHDCYQLTPPDDKGKFSEVDQLASLKGQTIATDTAPPPSTPGTTRTTMPPPGAQPPPKRPPKITRKAQRILMGWANQDAITTMEQSIDLEHKQAGFDYFEELRSRRGQFYRHAQYSGLFDDAVESALAQEEEREQVDIRAEQTGVDELPPDDDPQGNEPEGLAESEELPF